VTDQENANGTSQITLNSGDGSSTATSFSGPNGTGEITQVIQQNSSGTGTIVTLNSIGDYTFGGPFNGTIMVAPTGGTFDISFWYVSAPTLNYEASSYWNGASVGDEVFPSGFLFEEEDDKDIGTIYIPNGVFVTQYSGEVIALSPAYYDFMEEYTDVFQGSITEIDQENADGSSAITTYNDDGSSTTLDYTGANGTGTVTGAVFNGDVVPDATVVAIGNSVTVTPTAGGTAVLDGLQIDPYIGSNGTIETLIIQGSSGYAELGSALPVTNLEILPLGTLTLENGSILADPVTVYANGNITGYGTITGGEIVNGTITVEGGALDITGDINGSGTLTFAPGGSFLLEGTVAATENLVFSGGSESLILGTDANVSAPISDIGPFDTIGLEGQQVASAVYDTGTNVLAVTGSGGGTYDLNCLGSYQQSDFPVVKGEIVMPCFRCGTRIATRSGEILIEELAIGDLVQAHDAGLAPIKWIGHRCVDCRNHPKPQKVWPVRVCAGAFGDDMPHRDLWLSPDHAVFVDDVLIPIKRLVNGTSIEQVPMDEVTYYHIELEHHDVLLAEGLPAESYLDVGDRCNFANGGGPIALHPEFSPRRWDTAHIWEALGCARLILTGPELETVRRRVNSRAATVAPAVLPRQSEVRAAHTA
jgi:hypothetical protein